MYSTVSLSGSSVREPLHSDTVYRNTFKSDTGLDEGHQCSEFALLAATARVWRRYDWVVYASGPDEHLTPVAWERILG